MVDTFFNGFVQSKGFVGSCDKNHHLDMETQRVAVRVYKMRSERAHPHPAELRESGGSLPSAEALHCITVLFALDAFYLPTKS